MYNDLQEHNNLKMNDFNWMTYFDLQAISPISSSDFDIYT